MFLFSSLALGKAQRPLSYVTSALANHLNVLCVLQADVEIITQHNQTHDAHSLPNGFGNQANCSGDQPTSMEVDSQDDPSSAPASSTDSKLEEAKARVGFAVQLVNRALRGGEGPVLALVLIRLLPSLIRIQVHAISTCGPKRRHLPYVRSVGHTSSGRPLRGYVACHAGIMVSLCAPSSQRHCFGPV